MFARETSSTRTTSRLPSGAESTPRVRRSSFTSISPRVCAAVVDAVRTTRCERYLPVPSSFASDRASMTDLPVDDGPQKMAGTSAASSTRISHSTRAVSQVGTISS